MNQTLCTVVIHILFLLYTTYGETCDPNTKPKTVTQRVKDVLLCNHDKYSRPGLVTNNSTIIHLYIAPTTLEYDETTSTLRLNTYLYFTWQDDTLRWDENSYNISGMIVDKDQIWIPDLSLINWKEESVHTDQMDSTLMIDNSGNAYFMVMPELSGHCVPDLSKWPFDVQTCNFTLISRQYWGYQVDFMLFEYNTNNMDMEYFIPSRVWELVDYRAERIVDHIYNNSDTTFYQVYINISVKIKRHASVLTSSYIIPGFVMMLLSLVLLWFNPSTTSRIPVICVLIVLQSMFLKFLAYKIPSNGPKSPGIVIFYVGSLVITTSLLLLTMLTRSMATWASKPPLLTTILNLIRTNKILQLIFITDIKTYFEFAGDENEESLIKNPINWGNKEWFELALALNRVTFTILVPIYLVLFLHFIL